MLQVACLTNEEIMSQIQLKYLAEEMQAINKGLEKVMQELSMAESDGPVSDVFCQVYFIKLDFVLPQLKRLTRA